MRRDQLNRRTHQTSAAANTERQPSPQILQRGRAVRAGGGGGQIFVITDASGICGEYVCKKYEIDNSYWKQSVYHTKLIKVSDDEYDVFNLAEDNITVPDNALSNGDIIVAHQFTDNSGVRRWVGHSPKYAWWDI